jgi:hypothetical protein
MEEQQQKKAINRRRINWLINKEIVGDNDPSLEQERKRKIFSIVTTNRNNPPFEQIEEIINSYNTSLSDQIFFKKLLLLSEKNLLGFFQRVANEKKTTDKIYREILSAQLRDVDYDENKLNKQLDLFGEDFYTGFVDKEEDPYPEKKKKEEEEEEEEKGEEKEEEAEGGYYEGDGGGIDKTGDIDIFLDQEYVSNRIKEYYKDNEPDRVYTDLDDEPAKISFLFSLHKLFEESLQELKNNISNNLPQGSSGNEERQIIIRETQQIEQQVKQDVFSRIDNSGINDEEFKIFIIAISQNFYIKKKGILIDNTCFIKFLVRESTKFFVDFFSQNFEFSTTSPNTEDLIRDTIINNPRYKRELLETPNIPQKYVEYAKNSVEKIGNKFTNLGFADKYLRPDVEPIETEKRFIEIVDIRDTDNPIPTNIELYNLVKKEGEQAGNGLEWIEEEYERRGGGYGTKNILEPEEGLIIRDGVVINPDRRSDFVPYKDKYGNPVLSQQEKYLIEKQEELERKITYKERVIPLIFDEKCKKMWENPEWVLSKNDQKFIKLWIYSENPAFFDYISHHKKQIHRFEDDQTKQEYYYDKSLGKTNNYIYKDGLDWYVAGENFFYLLCNENKELHYQVDEWLVCYTSGGETISFKLMFELEGSSKQILKDDYYICFHEDYKMPKYTVNNITYDIQQFVDKDEQFDDNFGVWYKVTGNFLKEQNMLGFTHQGKDEPYLFPPRDVSDFKSYGVYNGPSNGENYAHIYTFFFKLDEYSYIINLYYNLYDTKNEDKGVVPLYFIDYVHPHYPNEIIDKIVEFKTDYYSTRSRNEGDTSWVNCRYLRLDVSQDEILEKKSFLHDFVQKCGGFLDEREYNEKQDENTNKDFFEQKRLAEEQGIKFEYKKKTQCALDVKLYTPKDKYFPGYIPDNPDLKQEDKKYRGMIKPMNSKGFNNGVRNPIFSHLFLKYVKETEDKDKKIFIIQDVLLFEKQKEFFREKNLRSIEIATRILNQKIAETPFVRDVGLELLENAIHDDIFENKKVVLQISPKLYCKEVEDIVFKKTKFDIVQTYLLKILNLTIYLDKWNTSSFRDRLKDGYYSPEVALNLNLQDKIPEVFANEEFNSAYIKKSKFQKTLFEKFKEIIVRELKNQLNKSAFKIHIFQNPRENYKSDFRSNRGLADITNYINKLVTKQKKCVDELRKNEENLKDHDVIYYKIIKNSVEGNKIEVICDSLKRLKERIGAGIFVDDNGYPYSSEFIFFINNINDKRDEIIKPKKEEYKPSAYPRSFEEILKDSVKNEITTAVVKFEKEKKINFFDDFFSLLSKTIRKFEDEMVNKNFEKGSEGSFVIKNNSSISEPVLCKYCSNYIKKEDEGIKSVIRYDKNFAIVKFCSLNCFSKDTDDDERTDVESEETVETEKEEKKGEEKIKEIEESERESKESEKEIESQEQKDREERFKNKEEREKKIEKEKEESKERENKDILLSKVVKKQELSYDEMRILERNKQMKEQILEKNIIDPDGADNFTDLFEKLSYLYGYDIDMKEVEHLDSFALKSAEDQSIGDKKVKAPEYYKTYKKERENLQEPKQYMTKEYENIGPTKKEDNKNFHLWKVYKIVSQYQIGVDKKFDEIIYEIMALLVDLRKAELRDWQNEKEQKIIAEPENSGYIPEDLKETYFNLFVKNYLHDGGLMNRNKVTEAERKGIFSIGDAKSKLSKLRIESKSQREELLKLSDQDFLQKIVEMKASENYKLEELEKKRKKEKKEKKEREKRREDRIKGITEEGDNSPSYSMS